MKNQEFLLNKYAGADEEFASADGMGDLYADDWNGFNDNNDLYVDANCNTNSKPAPAKPYIIKLYNSTASAISDVEFMNAVESIGADNNGVTAGIVATYEYPDITYKSFLQRLANEPFKAGLIRISSSSTTQIEKVFSVEVYNTRGKSYKETFVPQINTFQQISTKIDVEVDFDVNNYTQFKVASIEAGTTVIYTIYPKSVASSIASLNGKKAEQYIRPNISGMKMLK